MPLELKSSLRSLNKVSLCFRFIDIVNLTRFNSDTGSDVKMPTSLDERIDLEDKMNIRQMFDYTPDVDDILKSCFYRPDDWNFKLMSGPDCRSFVNVSRYLTQEYMCYMFSPIITPNIRLQSVTQSMYYQFMVYQITLNPNLSKVMFVNTAIFENELPYISRDFSVLTNLIGSQHMYSGIYLSVYPATFRFIRLQRPYDTMCRNLKTDIIFQCMHKCYMQNIQEIGGKIPASQIITAKSNYKIMGAKDLRDPMMSKRMTRLTDFCEKKCFFVSCNYNYTRATVVASPIEFVWIQCEIAY